MIPTFSYLFPGHSSHKRYKKRIFNVPMTSDGTGSRTLNKS